MIHDTITQLQQKRIILTASSGRCGTLLLSKLLSLIPSICSQHEPKPYIDNLFWRLRENPKLATRWLMKRKLPAMLADINSTNTSVYVETSHTLCKGFFEPLLDLGIVFDLIILSRDLRAVAMSFYNLDDVPIRSKSGRRWLLHPDNKTNVSSLPKPYSQYSNYQLCYWYVLEIELRKAMYYKTWGSIGQIAVKVDIKDLIQKRGFKSLLKSLSLPEPPQQAWHEYKLLSMTKHNIKSSRKAFMRSKGITDVYVQHAEKQEDRVREMIKYEDILDNIR